MPILLPKPHVALRSNRPIQGADERKLRSYGAKQNFYPGAVELLRDIKDLNENERYKEFDIRFENYIVSTGLKKTIEGSKLAEFVEKIWGCEFIEDEDTHEISEVAYSIDNTTKPGRFLRSTRA